MHNKLFIADGSVAINTEIGVLIGSSELARSVARSIAVIMGPKWTYRVTISPERRTRWMCDDNNVGRIVIKHDPDTSWWDRFTDGLLGLIPIEDQI